MLQGFYDCLQEWRRIFSFFFFPPSVSLRTIDHFYFRGLLSLSPAFLSKTDEEGHLLRMKMVKEQAEIRVEMASLFWRWIY